MCNHLNHLRISNFAIEEGEPSAIVGEFSVQFFIMA